MNAATLVCQLHGDVPKLGCKWSHVTIEHVADVIPVVHELLPKRCEGSFPQPLPSMTFDAWQSKRSCQNLGLPCQDMDLIHSGVHGDCLLTKKWFWSTSEWSLFEERVRTLRVRVFRPSTTFSPPPPPPPPKFEIPSNIERFQLRSQKLREANYCFSSHVLTFTSFSFPAQQRTLVIRIAFSWLHVHFSIQAHVRVRSV